MMNHNNQDQAKNNGKSEQSKGAEQKLSKESAEKAPQEQGEAMARGFMQGRAFRALCAAGAMLMVYRMGRRVMARRRAREARQ